MRKPTKAGLAVLVAAAVLLSGCTGNPQTPRTLGDFGPERALDQGGSVANLSWSPDGRLMAAALFDGGLRIWDTASYRLQVNMSGTQARLGLPAWSPNSGLIALAELGSDASRTVRIFNSSTGVPVAVIGESVDSPLMEGVRSLSWSPDGGHLAAGLSTGRVCIMNTVDWSSERVLGGNGSIGSGQESPAVVWSPDGQRLASLARLRLTIWDAADWSIFQNMSGCGARLVVWSLDGLSIGLVNSSSVGIISTSNWTLYRSIGYGPSDSWHAALSQPNLGMVAYPRINISGYKGTAVNVQNTTSRSVEKRLLAPANAGFYHVTALAWSPDGHRLAVAYGNSKVILWSHDADRDDYADLADRFPEDRTQWNDTDRDGYGDNPNGNNPDAFPNDPREWVDSDEDGMGDNGDPLPTMHNMLFLAIVIIASVAVVMVIVLVQRRQRRVLEAAARIKEGPATIQPFTYMQNCPMCGGALSPYLYKEARWLVCPKCGSSLRPPR